MIIDDLTLQLFGELPREVANPSRYLVHYQHEVRDFLMQNEGINDCYVSVYPHSGVIDKIFLDFDAHNGICSYDQALKDAKQVYRTLVEKGHEVAVLASGKKGIHLHILLKPYRYDTPLEAKTQLYNATLQVLKSAFGEIGMGTEYEPDGKASLVYYAVDEDNRVIGADPRVVGDIRRICRIPNTRRPPENKSWCTWLSDNFLKMDWIDVIKHTSEPMTRSRTAEPHKTLQSLPKYKGKIEVSPQSNPHLFDHMIPVKADPFLESQLRPCLYQALMATNPLHHARVAATIDLSQFYRAPFIAEIYQRLKWVDFDISTTIKQIHLCDGYKSYSCQKLKQYGLCIYKNRSECPIINGTESVNNGGGHV